jgi:hypothetical protein
MPVPIVPVAIIPVAAMTRIVTVVTAIMMMATMVMTVVTAMTVTGKRRHWKQQSSGYCTNERELPKHLALHFPLCCHALILGRDCFLPSAALWWMATLGPRTRLAGKGQEKSPQRAAAKQLLGTPCVRYGNSLALAPVYAEAISH